MTSREYFPFRDLWGSLFASMIAVLLIDRMVRRTELEKSKESIRFVKAKIAIECHKLIKNLKPPADWKKRIENRDSSWDDCLKRVWDTRVHSTAEFERLLDNYSHLMNRELENDIALLTSLLYDPDLAPFDLTQYQKSDDLIKYPKSELLGVVWVANVVSAVISNSIRIVRKYELLQSIVRYKTIPKGKTPTITLGDRGEDHEFFAKVQDYESALAETIEFKDKCAERLP